ncbi:MULTISPECIES: tail fiber assembly protein [Kosakonia]
MTTLNGWLDYIDAPEAADLSGTPDITWPEISGYV